LVNAIKYHPLQIVYHIVIALDREIIHYSSSPANKLPKQNEAACPIRVRSGCNSP
ncbi:hypothetical protein E4U43_007884, partial [Claviceps pusilla]